MNNKFLSMLSICLVLMIMTAGIGSAATAAETKQDSRLTALESKLNTLQTQVTTLQKTVTTLQTQMTKLQTQPFSAMFANFAEQIVTTNPIQGQLINVSFYLPVDSYVYIISNGIVSNTGTGAMLNTGIDYPGQPDWAFNVVHDGYFTVSSTQKMNKGYHTAYLVGESQTTSLHLDGVFIVVLANEKGGGIW